MKFSPIIVAILMFAITFMIGLSLILTRNNEVVFEKIMYKSYNLPRTDGENGLQSSISFFASAQHGNVVIYTGYGYNYANLETFAFDLADHKFIAQERYTFDGVDAICEGPDGIVLSRSTESIRITVREEVLVSEPTSLICPTREKPPQLCTSGSTVFYGRLPGRKEVLAACYAPDRREINFHVILQDGTIRDFGAGGASPGGRGQFVVTRGIQPNTFLMHHSQSLITESAVIIDLNTDTVTSFNMLDLTETQLSRGMGAGRFDITAHQINDGLIVESGSGSVFLVRSQTTLQIAEGIVARSVRVVNNGCGITLMARSKNGAKLRVYDICNQIGE